MIDLIKFSLKLEINQLHKPSSITTFLSLEQTKYYTITGIPHKKLYRCLKNKKCFKILLANARLTQT